MSDPVSSLLQRSLAGATNTLKSDALTKSVRADKPIPTGNQVNQAAQPNAGLPADTIDVSFLNDKAGTIARILENVGDSVSTIRDAQGRIGKITALLEQAGGIAVRARDTLKSTEDRAEIRPKLEELSTRFAKVLAEIDATAAESANPPNLLQGEDLQTIIDTGARGNSITQSIFISSGGLGLYPMEFGDATAPVADNVRGTVSNALDEVKLFSQQLAGDMNTLQTVQDFSLNAMQLLSSQASAPVLSSTAEEAANLLALQVRQQLAGSDVSLANENQRALLQQF
ncbi:MAG: hypothetical protein V4621_04180 [Pseudomonadota bacterium]